MSRRLHIGFFVAASISSMLAMTVAQARAADCPVAARTLGEIAQEDPASTATETKLRDVIAKCPELAEAHFQLGTSLLKQNRPLDAIKSFQRAVELKRDPLFYVALGNASFRVENFKSAQSAYEDALKLDSNNPKAMQGLSALAYKQGKLGPAEESLRHAIQVNPENPDLFFNLGVILLQSGRTEEALESFRAASERKSPFPEADIQLGSTYLKLGQFEQAERSFRQAALHEPRNPDVWLGLGSALDGMRNYSAALSQIDKALAIDPKNPLARLNYAIVEIKSGKADQAVAKLQQMVAEDPNNGSFFGALGWGLLQLKRNDEAQQALESAIRLNPRDPFALNNLGVLYQLRGDSAKAREIFEQAKELGSSVSEIDSNLNALRD